MHFDACAHGKRAVFLLEFGAGRRLIVDAVDGPDADAVRGHGIDAPVDFARIIGTGCGTWVRLGRLAGFRTGCLAGFYFGRLTGFCLGRAAGFGTGCFTGFGRRVRGGHATAIVRVLARDLGGRIGRGRADVLHFHADADGERAVFLPEFGAGIGCEVAPGHRPLTGEPVRGHGFDGALPVGLAGRGCLAVPKQYGGKDRSNDDQGAVQLGWGKIVHGRSSPMA